MPSHPSRSRPEISRRHFLGHLAATGLGIPAMQFFASLRANAEQVRKNHRSCILLWMSGGPSHLDIWDLKPDSEKNGGPFRPIATSAPGVQISEHLPRVAKQMHHLNIIRSLDSKEGNHERGTYLMHSGYVPNPTVVHPGWGSVCAYELGEQRKELDLPHCVAINEPGMSAGFLGMSYSPFVVQNPNAADRQSQAAGRRRRHAAGAPAPDARPGREPVHRATARAHGRRSQGRLQQDPADDELEAQRHLRPGHRARRDPRGLRQGLVRLGLPAGPAAGGAGGHLRRGFPRRLGHPHEQLRYAVEPPASRARQGHVGPGGRPGRGKACSTARSSSGWASSAGPRGSTRTRAATTGREAGRS